MSIQLLHLKLCLSNEKLMFVYIAHGTLILFASTLFTNLHLFIFIHRRIKIQPILYIRIFLSICSDKPTYIYTDVFMKNFLKDICNFIRYFSYDLTSIISCIKIFSVILSCYSSSGLVY